jgi:hypothetical protein
LVFSTQQSGQFTKALPVQVSHRFGADSAVFDDEGLVSCAGLVPVMTLAAQSGLRGELGLDPVRRDRHNLLRAAGVLAAESYAVARGATLRRRIVSVPARLARPQRRPILHLPTNWPWSDAWLALWHNTIGCSPPLIATT